MTAPCSMPTRASALPRKAGSMSVERDQAAAASGCIASAAASSSLKTESQRPARSAAAAAAACRPPTVVMLPSGASKPAAFSAAWISAAAFSASCMHAKLAVELADDCLLVCSLLGSQPQ